jgi:hypothetical protein
MEEKQDKNLEEKYKEKLKRFEVNEHNVRVLLEIVLSIMTEEQLKKLRTIFESLESGIQEEEKEKVKSYIN